MRLQILQIMKEMRDPNPWSTPVALSVPQPISATVQKTNQEPTSMEDLAKEMSVLTKTVGDLLRVMVTS